MPASFTFDLPASPGCPARPCGAGNRCFLLLTEGAAAKSADGSGVLLGTITAVAQVNLTLWRYTVQVADGEMAETPTAGEMQLFLSCIGAESEALLKKMGVIEGGAPILTMAVWSPDSLFALQDTVVVGPRWLGTVPYKFLPEGGMRISANQNTGMSVELSLTIGQSNAPLLDSAYLWAYAGGVDSVVVPFSAFTAAIRAGGMPAGARVDVTVDSVSGPYGFDLKGLRFDFIGRWVP
jgi:hypothetical protein